MIKFLKRWWYHYSVDKSKRTVEEDQGMQRGVDWDEAIASGVEYMIEQENRRRRYD
ncbi:hypothetical protein [Vibrio sp. 10N.261.46.A3]|uniref:hypothetical protein n=1 Tax=Vibrio sp. 10N.261.46.A3 TaxID=3229658 RepID=UPI003554189E